MVRARTKRLAIVAVLALLIAPGTWWRDRQVKAAQDLVRLERLAVAQPDGWPASLTLEGAWNMANANPAFGGFSALKIDPGQRGFIAWSDRGNYAHLPRPPLAGRAPAQTQPFARDPLLGDPQDIESVTSDPATGTLWFGYENHNAIRRVSTNGSSQFVQPEAMSHWTENSGPEAMVRLGDGRFVVLAERGGEGLLFAGDPIESGEPEQFSVRFPDDYRPTAMAQLPDGRVLVLLRAVRWTLPPFASLLMLGDPKAIRAGETWPLTQLARIDHSPLRENYEGMAIEPAGEGAATIWLIADDNLSLIQRNLLVKLRYAYAADKQTAREARMPAGR